MNWNIKKLEGGDNPNFLTFEVIEQNNNGNGNKVVKREDIFSYQARMFIKNFEGFSQTKEKPENSGETPQEKTARENTAYPYYDSEGIPTIGHGFNLTERAIFEIVKEYLQPSNSSENDYKTIRELKFEKKRRYI